MDRQSAVPDRGRLRTAWTLVLLTTFCAELTFTAVAVPITWLLLPLLMVMYGAGVLLIREAVVRVGGGWPSLVLLGLAYELAEDGVGLQALTSPNMYGAADWGWRAGGVNLTYWASQIGVHVVFSVLVPVMLADLLFPSRRGRPYLRRGGFIGIGALAIVGVFGLRVVISATEDPGYRTPLLWTAVFVVGIAVLSWLALRVLPRATVPQPVPAAAAPRPAVVGVACAAATLVYLALLLPLGLGSRTVLGDSVPGPVPLVIAALTAAGIGWAALRWCTASNWSRQHQIWLAGGILIAHTAFMMPGSPITIITGTATVVLEVTLLAALTRRLTHPTGSL